MGKAGIKQKQKSKPGRKRRDTQQSERFKAAARELGADQGGEALMERVFTNLVPPKRKAEHQN